MTEMEVVGEVDLEVRTAENDVPGFEDLQGGQNERQRDASRVRQPNGA